MESSKKIKKGQIADFISNATQVELAALDNIKFNNPTGKPSQYLDGKGAPTDFNMTVLGDKNFLFYQSIPSKIWTIDHPLKKKPSVTVLDSAGTEVKGHVKYNSINQVVLTFSAAFSGEATLN